VLEAAAVERWESLELVRTEGGKGMGGIAMTLFVFCVGNGPPGGEGEIVL
jgi:hypothetical protein